MHARECVRDHQAEQRLVGLFSTPPVEQHLVGRSEETERCPGGYKTSSPRATRRPRGPPSAATYLGAGAGVA